MINLLSKRGDCLKQAKFGKAKEIETKIEAYKNAHYEDVVSPVHAFVIFEKEAARNVALARLFRKSFSFGEHPLQVKPA